MTERKDLEAIEISKLGETLQAQLNEFKESLESKESVDELVSMEDELMAKMKENDKYLEGVVYDLPKEVTFENRKYSRTQISNYVVDFLDKAEVEFPMTLGMHQLVTIWRGEPKSLDYHKYDSTLRCLGTLKFKGDKEWEGILATNEFLSGVHEQYTRDTTYLIFISQMHSAILDRMQALQAPAEEVKEEPAE